MVDTKKIPLYTGDPRQSVLIAIRNAQEGSSDVFIYGDEGVGKTTLIKESLGLSKSGKSESEETLYCSSIEIFAALFIRESERFLQNLADTPLVVIDDVEMLLKEENGPESLALLLNERERNGFRTILLQNGDLQNTSESIPQSFIDKCEQIELEGLNDTQLEDFAYHLLEQYSTEESPKFDRETAKAIVSVDPCLKSIDSAALYLMTASNYESEDFLGSKEVELALQS